jgi:hypothetical protein
MLDMRQPIGHGFRERRMINIADPDSLYIIDSDDAEIPPDRLALPRVIYEHMRGHPFACGPLLGSRQQPVGALGLSSYRGRNPIPDALFARGLLRAFMDHLGIAMERARDVSRLERLNTELLRAQATIANDARMKAIGELAAAVAHDLNNLSGVALMAASVGMRSPAEAYDALPRIARANRAIGDLVARLQRVARPASGLDELHRVANIRQVVDDILSMVSSMLGELSIELEVDLPPTLWVHADPVLVHQVVLNLVLNARDALGGVPADRRRLRISAREEGDATRLIVSDSGTGIAEEVLPHLFRPFVTTKTEGHAGLGLAAAQASLRHFGGGLDAHNAAEGGAVFVISFAPAVAMTDAAVADLSVEHTRKGTILAVDDDPDIVIIIRAYLEPLGYRVVTAASGDQALEIARAELFDLILCDVGMPKRNGLDVCSTLRSSGYRGKLVLMTGWDGERVKADLRATSCDTLLRKPFVGADLLRTIDSLLANRQPEPGGHA